MITTEELTTLKSDLSVYFAKLGRNNFNAIKFGTELCKNKYDILKELLMYQWVLFTWQQYSDGTPVESINYITITDFDRMINRIKFIIYG